LSSSAITIGDGASGSIVYRDNNGKLRARDSIVVSATNGSVAIGGTIPGRLPEDSHYVDGHAYVSGTGYFGRGLTMNDDRAVGWGDSTVRMQGSGVADTFPLHTNNLERLRVGSNGYVGIANLNPNAELDVMGR